MTELDRRTLLKAATISGGLAMAGPFQGLLARAALASEGRLAPAADGGYGPLLTDIPDLRDGVVRLHLPEGFQYRSFSWANTDPLEGGGLVPGRQDGMAAFPRSNTKVRLVRNHEINGNAPDGALPHCPPYDSAALGGTTTIEVTGRGAEARTWVSCSGTQQNCAGGEMPWGSWVTAEETINGPDVGPDFTGTPNTNLREKHGYIFEVPSSENPDQVSRREPIRSAGRFAHEAVALDPITGILYLTEDNFAFPSGLYRYRLGVSSTLPRRLVEGGVLEMLRVKGQPDLNLSGSFPQFTTFETEWVLIADPDPTFAPGTTNDQALVAVGNQGRAQGAAQFSRLEGIILDRGRFYLNSTQGGGEVPGTPGSPTGFGNGFGQVWVYDPVAETLTLLYQSPGKDVLELPDNITASPRGTVLLCEDGTVDNFLRGLTTDGELFDFAKNAIAGRQQEEFAGATFGPDGKVLYVNIQSGALGLTFAVWGPWARGPF